MNTRSLAPLALALLTMLLVSGADAQTIFPNIRISSPAEEPEEVTIAINPLNPAQLVAAANLSYYAFSNDSGRTWEEGHLGSQFGVWGDPCVIFDPSGHAYIGHLSNPRDGYWLDRLVVQKSTDGGATWNGGAPVGGDPPTQQDKEWLIADYTGSPYHGNLYVCWTQFDHYGSTLRTDSSRILFARSTNGGESWSDPVRVGDLAGDCLDRDSTVQGAVPAVGPAGEIYTCWSYAGKIFFDRSTDGGATFGADRFVTDQPGGWDIDIPGLQRCNGFPVTLCDLSGSANRGSLYVVWADQRNGATNTDIFLSRSTDRGESWSPRVRVNQDTTATQQFFHWATIDQSDGDLYVVYYDRRATAGNATDVFVARSTDGGRTFTDMRVSRSPFVPDASQFLGDYIGIAAHGGIAYPLWTRMDSGRTSAWIAVLGDSSRTLGVGAEPRSGMGGEGFEVRGTPYTPFAKVYVTLPRRGPMTVTVHNSLGVVVRELASGEYPEGMTTLWWDGVDADGVRAPNGAYFVRLVTPLGTRTEKLMLMR
jgi:hypothetical protein